MWYPGQEEQTARVILVGACTCGCCPLLQFAAASQATPKLTDDDHNNDNDDEDDDDNLAQPLTAAARINYLFAVRGERKPMFRTKTGV